MWNAHIGEVRIGILDKVTLRAIVFTISRISHFQNWRSARMILYAKECSDEQADLSTRSRQRAMVSCKAKSHRERRESAPQPGVLAFAAQRLVIDSHLPDES